VILFDISSHIFHADTTSVFEIDPSSLEPTQFMVTVIVVEMEKKTPKYKHIIDMTLDYFNAGALDHFMGEQDDLLLIISPILGPTDYTFSVTK